MKRKWWDKEQSKCMRTAQEASFPRASNLSSYLSFLFCEENEALHKDEGTEIHWMQLVCTQLRWQWVLAGMLGALGNCSCSEGGKVEVVGTQFNCFPFCSLGVDKNKNLIFLNRSSSTSWFPASKALFYPLGSEEVHELPRVMTGSNGTSLLSPDLLPHRWPGPGTCHQKDFSQLSSN